MPRVLQQRGDAFAQAGRCRRRRRCAAVCRWSRDTRSGAGGGAPGGVHHCLWAPVVSAPGSPTPGTSSELSTRSPASSRKAIGLSRCMRRSCRSSAARSAGSSARCGRPAPGDDLLRCVRTWHAGGGFPEFEALSEQITLAPGEGLPGRGRRSRASRRGSSMPRRTRTSLGPPSPGAAVCTRRSGSRCSVPGASSA